MQTYWSSMAKRATPYVPGEQMNEKYVLKLNTNENPYPPSQAVIRAITEAANTDLRRYPSPDPEQLRELIGKTYDLTKDQVFIGNGSDEVLAFSFMAFFEPGETIRFPEITYSFYPVYAQLFAIPYEPIPMQADLSLDIERFFHSEGGVIFPNPNAPTSMAIRIEEIRKILEQNPTRVVIVDEAYVDFSTKSAVSLINEYSNLLIVQTTSKSRSLAGLRVGYALGNEDLIQALIQIKDSINSYTLDRLAIAGATASFFDSLTTKDNIKKIIQTRTWVSEKMKAYGFQVLPSETNFIFVTHPKVSARQLYAQLKQRQVLVRYFNQPTISQYLRITIGTDKEMEQFFKRLDQVIKSCHRLG
ncbi:MAG TPA: histidinol-phosphate transaminase [Cerasibacillus sp.]|uniref:histidinol-phosphate transaminase n=1 Tax=Cerasibacillus sp. TaxID=2498711 RepID=UPI002F3E61AB